MSQRRLTLVISSLGAGGAERVLTNMANAWAEKGWQITLLTFSGSGESPFYQLHPDVTLQPLDIAKASKNSFVGIINNVKRLFVLRQAIVTSYPDRVISFMDRTNVITLLALFCTGIRVIAAERSNPELSLVSWSWKLLRRITYPFAYKIIVQTERGRAMFPSSLRNKIIAIPNPVHPPLEEVTETILTRPCIVGVGRFTYEKGFDQLINAFASICEHAREWNLVLLGDGPLRGSLEELTFKLGISSRVIFYGNVKKPIPVMKQADIFVLPSRMEGFPNALCEAMASGLPVISTDCPTGPKEIIRDGIDGILVSPEDVSALAKAMETLMSNDVLRKLLGQNARNVTERFKPERIMQLWENTLYYCNNN